VGPESVLPTKPVPDIDPENVKPAKPGKQETSEEELEQQETPR
jgi:hypothetical protein